MSNLSTITGIADGSEATTGLWNSRHSKVNDNFSALNSELSDVSFKLSSTTSGVAYGILSRLSVTVDAASAQTLTAEYGPAATPLSGALGLKLSRSTMGSPLALSLYGPAVAGSSASTFQWDTAALDSSTSDLVLAFDPDLMGGSGDILRFAKKHASGIFGAGVGSPNTNIRFTIASGALSKDSSDIILQLQGGDSATTPSATKALNVSWKGVNAFSVLSQGQIAVKKTSFAGYAGIGVGAEIGGGVVSVGTGTDPLFRLRRADASDVNATEWDLKTDRAGSSATPFVITDVGRGANVVEIESNNTSNAIYVASSGSVQIGTNTKTAPGLLSVHALGGSSRFTIDGLTLERTEDAARCYLHFGQGTGVRDWRIGPNSGQNLEFLQPSDVSSSALTPGDVRFSITSTSIASANTYAAQNAVLIGPRGIYLEPSAATPDTVGAPGGGNYAMLWIRASDNKLIYTDDNNVSGSLATTAL